MWIFHSRLISNKINNVHRKELISVYSDYKSTFQELLMHHKNSITLTIEIYKHVRGTSPAIMEEVSKINRTLPYSLRTNNEFFSRVHKTVKYGVR